MQSPVQFVQQTQSQLTAECLQLMVIADCMSRLETRKALWFRNPSIVSGMLASGCLRPHKC